MPDATRRRFVGKARSPRSLPALALAFIALGAIAGPAGAGDDSDPAPARRIERPRFSIDAGSVSTADSTHVATQVVVPYSELLFRPEGDEFVAKFDLIVVLMDGGRQIAGDLWEEEVRTPSRSATRSSERSFERTVLLPARDGRLKAVVTVSERASGNEGRLEQDVTVTPPRRDRFSIGKIWFGRCDADSIDSTLDLPRRPLVSRRFGSAQGAVCAWSRVYAPIGSEGRPVEIVWRVLDDRRQVAHEDRIHAESRVGGIPLRVRIPTEKLWLGGYELWIGAGFDTPAASRASVFDMDETMVSLDHNPAESIALIRYIARSEEIEEIEQAAPDARQKAWDSFWKRRDPTPETEVNEFKQEFFDRVRYANEHFSTLGPGWRSDRGMIYIQYGPPDQLESYPHNIDGPPYEIWSYYSVRRRFLFVDYDGFGRYELYTPGRH